MKKYLATLPLIALLLLAAVSYTPAFAAHSSKSSKFVEQNTIRMAAYYRQVKDCGEQAPQGFARCLAIRLQPTHISPHKATDLPSGYTPANLQDAYKLPSATGGKGQTIAIVDAQDDPNAETDLAVYRSTFGLPACTTANGCFKKVDQQGGTHYPTPDPGWSGEIALDLDMVSAICPNCHILLVEAKSASFGDLGNAVNTAVRLGAAIVSNSYGGEEDFWSALTVAHYYNHARVAIIASSGDNGYGVQFPAAFNSVIAVGGTSLTQNTSIGRGWTESVWNGAGSGCSKYIGKPSWQKDSTCRHRTVTDVSAVADPNTGVAVYNTYNSDGSWFIYGGTSVSSPIIAGVYALAGNATKINPSAYLYSRYKSLFDVTTGKNGSCTPSYLCNASIGYDGPTGLGTPNGTAAF